MRNYLLAQEDLQDRIEIVGVADPVVTYNFEVSAGNDTTLFRFPKRNNTCQRFTKSDQAAIAEKIKMILEEEEEEM